MKKKLSGLIEKAIEKHQEVGLSITHKVHLIEDNIEMQFSRLPIAFFFHRGITIIKRKKR